MTFDTPAYLQDVPADSQFYARWSAFVSGHIEAETRGDNGGAFYNPALTQVEIVGEKAMVWMGFPRDVLLPDRRDDKTGAFAEAEAEADDARTKHNEYFEWRVERNSAGMITKVTFVTEFRRYFEQLWEAGHRDAVVRIYRELVSPDVKETDLHSNGTYNVFNRWNTSEGIVHYIQNINTLRAAVGLCQESVHSPTPRHDNYVAQPPYHRAPTSVDPRVSYDVHMLVRQGLYVTLKNPIGFYIADWNNAGIATPDGKPAPASWWKIRRGKPGMVLRLEYEVPADIGYCVGDLTLGGRPIRYGGQLAEEITVVIHGTAGRGGGRQQ